MAIFKVLVHKTLLTRLQVTQKEMHKVLFLEHKSIVMLTELKVHGMLALTAAPHKDVHSIFL